MGIVPETMRQPLAGVVMLCWIVCGGGPTAAQFPEPQVFAGAPAALWIFPPGAAGHEFGVFHVRRVFELAAKPASFVVHVSADNRYRLYVNGDAGVVRAAAFRRDALALRDARPRAAAARRPQRDRRASCGTGAPSRPVAQHSLRTGFLLQGDSPREAVANTGAGWKLLRDRRTPDVRHRATYRRRLLRRAPGESVDGATLPVGLGATRLRRRRLARGRGRRTGARRATPTLTRAQPPSATRDGGWQLEPRTIPPMEETPVRFATVRRERGHRPVGAVSCAATGDLVVPPSTRAVLLLDQAHMTNAYTVLETSGGAGSTVTLTYAEALIDAAGKKGQPQRDRGPDASAASATCSAPTAASDDGSRRSGAAPTATCRSRSQTADEPLRIHDLHGIFTAYPFVERGRFDERPALARATCGHELERRAHRRVRDVHGHAVLRATPVRRRHAHAGAHLAVRVRRRPARAPGDRALRPSRIPEGITASRYPSELQQIIPPFSLDLRGDGARLLDAPRRLRRSCAALAGDARQCSTGTGATWTRPACSARCRTGTTWTGPALAARRSRRAPTTGTRTVSLAAVRVRAPARRRARGRSSACRRWRDRYRARADESARAVRARAWDARGACSATRPTRRVQPADERARDPHRRRARRRAARLMERVLPTRRSSPRPTTSAGTCSRRCARPDSATATSSSSRRGGRCSRSASRRRRRSRSRRAPTRTPGPRTRTTGCSPPCSACVLRRPGFGTVRIAPQLGPLQRAEGRVPHPRGDIEVRLARTAGGGLRGEVTLPEGLAGVLVWGGKETALRPGRQELSF